MLDIIYELAYRLHSHVFFGVDTDSLIYIYITDLEALKDKRFYIDLTGRGVSLEDASYEYVKLLLSGNYILRHRRIRGYITKRIRSFVRKQLQPIYLLEQKGNEDQ